MDSIALAIPALLLVFSCVGAIVAAREALRRRER